MAFVIAAVILAIGIFFYTWVLGPIEQIPPSPKTVVVDAA